MQYIQIIIIALITSAIFSNPHYASLPHHASPTADAHTLHGLDPETRATLIDITNKIQTCTTILHNATTYAAAQTNESIKIGSKAATDVAESLDRTATKFSKSTKENLEQLSTINPTIKHELSISRETAVRIAGIGTILKSAHTMSSNQNIDPVNALLLTAGIFGISYTFEWGCTKLKTKKALTPPITHAAMVNEQQTEKCEEEVKEQEHKQD